MAVQHGLQDLLDTVTGIGLTVILPGHNVLKQLPTGNQVEDQVMVSLLGDAVVEPDCGRGPGSQLTRKHCFPPPPALSPHPSNGQHANFSGTEHKPGNRCFDKCK